MLLICSKAFAVNSGDTATLKGIEFHKDIPDTTLLGGTYRFYFTPNKVKIDLVEYPTFSATGMQFIDKLDRLDGNYYISKGTIGQIHQIITPTFDGKRQWHYQPNLTPGYSKQPYTICFYQAKRPYTLLSYTSSLNKEYCVHASHTQNIHPRWNVSIDIDFINPEDIYANSNVMNTYADVTTNYYSKDSRYQLYGGMILQKQRISENGGLTSDDLFSTYSQLNNLTSLPVVSMNNGSIFKDLTLFAHQSYNTVRQVTTTVKRTRIELSKTDSATLDTIEYVDTLQPSPFKLLNSGVIAFDIAYHRWNRQYLDSIQTHTLSTRLFWTNDAYPDSRFHNTAKTTIGIKPEFIGINEHDTAYHSFASLSPYFIEQIALPFGTISGEAEYTIGGGHLNGNNRMALNYTHHIDSCHNATLLIEYSNKAADYFYYHYTSNDLIWHCPNLNKTNTLRLDLSYRYSNIMTANITATNINNYVFLDENIRPHQANNNIYLLQGKILHHTELWHFLHWDMQHTLQYSSNSDDLAVPLFATKNSIYTDFHIFHHALLVQAGLDLRYHTAYYADAYSPAAGAFYRQKQVKIGNYLWGDIFLNLQLQRAVIYLKLGHVNSIWETHPNFFTLPHYPGNKFGFYYGVVWKFFD